MSFITKAFYIFTPYTDANERQVARFFKQLDEHSSQKRTRVRLSELVQRNIAVINLWTESQYKGYRYLSKSTRRKLYTNLDLIAADFDQFYQNASFVEIAGSLTSVDPQKSKLLQAMMHYLSPRRGIYEYRDSSSFSRLLRDPAQEKLVGDCNQIVTLYIYIYSRYYDVRELQVRILPEHVALNVTGTDIEATSATFADYRKRKGSKLLPIEEIVCINLLDTTDAYLATHEVAPEDFLQAARFAFILSHERDTVRHNLKVAYGQEINTLMKQHSYGKALTFALASHDIELLNAVGHNGALHEIQQHNYSSARRFAKHALKQDELIRSSWQAEGIHYSNNRQYKAAIKAFKHAGDDRAVRSCYEALFFDEQKKLGSTFTSETIKNHTRTIKHMRDYAKKSGNKKIISYTKELKKHLANS